MSELINRQKRDLSEVELTELEEFEQENGPLNILQNAVENGTQILISLRNNKKILARIKAFDRHSNMILVNAKEMWSERSESASGKKGKLVQKDRFISKMFLRGDGVVLVVAA